MAAGMWRFIDIDKINGVYSTALFDSVARHVGNGSSSETIFFWRVNAPVIYLGYHQCVEDEINDGFCRRNNIGIVRRVLGGGCGFCDENQILYSVIGKEGGVIPGDIQSAYKKVLDGVVITLDILGAGGKIEPSRNAVYSKNRKISGNAQGRFDGAVLINGSLLLDFDFELMDMALKHPTKNLHPVSCAREGMITLKEMGITDIETVKKTLRQGFEKALGISLKVSALTHSEEQTAEQLMDKYTQDKWTYRMDIKRKLRKKAFAPLLRQDG